MQIDGAIVRERGVVFAVVSVHDNVVRNRVQAAAAIRGFGPVFPGIPVILMARDASGRPTYFGRQDIASFLSHVAPDRLPWKRYTLN